LHAVSNTRIHGSTTRLLCYKINKIA
jgi:hypothetical protein